MKFKISLVNKYLYIFISILFNMNGFYFQTSLKQFLHENIEKQIVMLAEKLINAYESNEYCKGCLCSNYMCSHFVNLTCDTRYPVRECGNCSRRVDLQNSSVFLNDSTRQAEQGIKEMVCLSKTLDKYFQENYYENKKSNGILRWQSFGSWNGLFRIYPGRERCLYYDNRATPWYVTSTTGNKDIVLILDYSSQTLIGDKESITKLFSNLFVQSITFNDFVGIVIVGGKNQVYTFEDELVRANYTNKKKIQAFISEIKPEGDPNYYLAFKKAFDILEISRKQENVTNTSGSQPIIVFVNNGKSSSINEVEYLTNFYNKKSIEYDPFYQKQPFLFAFTIEENADEDLCGKLTCQLGGVYHHINNLNEIYEAFIESYLNILIKSHKNNGVKWSDIYDNPTELGEMASVTVPIYIDNNGTSFLLGVVIGSTMLSDIIQFPYTLEDFYQFFKNSNSDLKTEINLSDCEIESMRKNKCGLNHCSNNNYRMEIPNKCPVFFNNKYNLFCYDIVDELPPNYGCCTYNACTGWAMAIGFGYSFGILIIGISIISLYYFYYNKKIINTNDNNSERITINNDRTIKNF